jgi:hypothetical protein
VRGEIRRQGGDERPVGSPLTLFSGGLLRLFGKVCPGAVLATDMPPREGEVREPYIPTQPSSRAVPAEAPQEAESWTEWQRIPEGRGQADEVRLEGLRGIEVACQIVGPNPNDPSRPADDESLLPQPTPLPLAVPLMWSAGSFVRFHLRARLVPGHALPCLRGIVMLSR